MKTYNCFQFYNELDILEIRLQECWDSTDYFVITESSHTHAGNLKNYVLLDNWERFKPYADKIRRIQVDETLEDQRKIFPNDSTEWVREKYQRYALVKGIYDMNPEDLIVLSDCDEVPRGKLIEMIKHDENDYDRYLLNITQFHFRLNYMRIIPEFKFTNIISVRGRAFTNFMAEREFTFPWFPTPKNSVYLEHGGWHWSDFGNDQHVINKLQNFCHLDVNNPEYINNINLDNFINNKLGRDSNEIFEYVIMDDYFPKCITDNLDRWKHMIIPNAQHHVEDFYSVEEK